MEDNSENSKNKYIKLINNSGIFFLGNVGSKLIGLIFLLASTHILSPEEFGVIEIVKQTTSLIFPIASIAIAEAVFRFAMDTDEDPSVVFTNGLAVIVIGSLALLVISPALRLIKIFDTFIVYLLALIIVQMIQAVAKQFIRAIGKVKLFVISDLFNSISLLLCGLVFVFYFHWGIKGYLLSYILAYGFDSLFLIIVAKLYIYVDKNKISLLQIRKMTKYSLPLTPNSIMWWLTETSNRYFILYILGASMTGIYAVAVRIPSLIAIFSSVFFKAWQMAAVEEYLSKDKSQFYSKVFEVFWTGMVLLTSIIFIILHCFMAAFISPEFQEAWKYIPLLIIASVFSTFQAFIGTNYTAAKNTIGALKTSASAAVINILLNIILIPQWGLYGAAIATIVSYLFVFIFRCYDTAKFVKINIDYFKFILSFIILIIQILFLLMYSVEMSYISGILCFCILFIINRNIIISIEQIIKKFMQSRLKISR